MKKEPSKEMQQQLPHMLEKKKTNFALSYLEGEMAAAEHFLDTKRLVSLDMSFIHHRVNFDTLALSPILKTMPNTKLNKAVSVFASFFNAGYKKHRAVLDSALPALPIPKTSTPKQTLRFQIDQNNVASYQAIAVAYQIPAISRLTSAFEYVLSPQTEARHKQWLIDFPRFKAINTVIKKKKVNVKARFYPDEDDKSKVVDAKKQAAIDKKAKKYFDHFIPKVYRPYVEAFTQDHGNSCYAFLVESFKFIDRPFIPLKIDSNLEFTKINKHTYESQYVAKVMMIWAESHLIFMDQAGDLHAMPKEECDRVHNDEHGYYVIDENQTKIMLSPLVCFESTLTMKLASTKHKHVQSDLKQSIQIDLMHQTLVYDGPDYSMAYQPQDRPQQPAFPMSFLTMKPSPEVTKEDCTKPALDTLSTSLFIMKNRPEVKQETTQWPALIFHQYDAKEKKSMPVEDTASHSLPLGMETQYFAEEILKKIQSANHADDVDEYQNQTFTFIKMI